MSPGSLFRVGGNLPLKGVMMNKQKVNLIALAIGLSFGVGAMAQGITKDDYKAGKDQIAVDYKAAKVGCESLSGNANDICLVEAKGRAKVTRAELDASYTPSRKHHYQLRIARAEANYAVAKERCDDKAGHAKDVCVEEAKAAETAAKADAKAQKTTSDANDQAVGKSAEAYGEANKKAAEARKDASVDKLDAQYSLAKEKCETFAGGAKDVCMDQARIRFGK